MYHSGPSNFIARNHFVSISIQNPERRGVLDTNKRCDVRAIETTSKMFEVHPYLETPRVEDLLWTANVSSRYGDSPNWL